MKSLVGRSFLLEEYSKKERSPYDIAEELNTYPNAVRRALKYHGIPLRDKAKAQKIALASGRSEHPTKGKQHSPKTKDKMSRNISKAISNIPEERKKEWHEKLKKKWAALSIEDKKNLQTLAAQARRKTIEDGSKLEQFILVGLRTKGYDTQFHFTPTYLKKEMHIDIFLPKEKIAIEIDGPTHFEDIWGKHELQKMIFRDTRKNGMMVTNGCNVVRIRQYRRNVSQAYFRELLEKLLETIEKIKLRKEPDVFIIEGF